MFEAQINCFNCHPWVWADIHGFVTENSRHYNFNDKNDSFYSHFITWINIYGAWNNLHQFTLCVIIPSLIFLLFLPTTYFVDLLPRFHPLHKRYQNFKIWSFKNLDIMWLYSAIAPYELTLHNGSFLKLIHHVALPHLSILPNNKYSIVSFVTLLCEIQSRYVLVK